MPNVQSAATIPRLARQGDAVRKEESMNQQNLTILYERLSRDDAYVKL